MSSTASAFRVLVVNAWGGNRGDEAMLNALYRLLFAIRADIQVDVLRFRDEPLEILPAMRVIPGRCGTDYYSGSRLIKLAARSSGWQRRGLRVLARVLSFLGLLENGSLSGYDLVLSAPQGPTISDIYRLKYLTLYPLRQVQRRRIPYGILGVSMGPFDAWTLDQSHAGRVLAGARQILVREDISLSHVARKYPGLKNLGSAIDIVFADMAWRRRPLDAKAAFRDYMSRLKPGAIGACISLTPARDPRNAFDRKAYLQTMGEFFRHVIEATGRPLYLFPHLAFDMPSLEQLKSMLGPAAEVMIVPPQFDSDDQRQLMASLDFFVSSRYHPTIFAIQAGIPFLCIKNQFKVEGMLEKLGLFDIPTCWQDEAPAVMKSRFERCWAEREVLRERVAHAHRIAAAEAEKFTVSLKAIMPPAH